MNYYYVDANLSKWGEIKALVDHVYRVAQAAARGPLPPFGRVKG